MPVLFAFGKSRPLAFFAGTLTSWIRIRKLSAGEVTCELFALLTTHPNREGQAIHPRAMPVILTEPTELDTWLPAPRDEAGSLQRVFPDGALQIVAQGEEEDKPAGMLSAAAEPAKTATPARGLP